MQISLETPIDHNNAFYYAPGLEPVEFNCSEQLINNQEEYDKSKLIIDHLTFIRLFDKLQDLVKIFCGQEYWKNWFLKEI